MEAATMSVKQASEVYQKSLDDLISIYTDWLKNRRNTIKKLKEIVKDMDSDEFRNNVANIVAGGVGVTTGAVMIGALLSAPFTGGASLVVAGVAAGVGAAGGVANLVGDKYAENYAVNKCKEADHLIKADVKKSGNLEKAEAKLTEVIVILQNESEKSGTDILKLMKDFKVKDKGMKVFKIARKTVKFARQGHGVVSAFGRASGKVLSKATGKFFAIVGIGLDIWQIVSSSQDIGNGSKSELGKGITKHILDLEKSLNAVEKYFSETYEFNY